MEITTDNIEEFAIGATVLGAGGGGNPRIGKLMARQALEKHGPVPLLHPSAVPTDAMIVPVGRVGAPTVMTEKLPGKAEQIAVFEAFESYLGQQPYATMCIEAGGMNSTVPIAVAAELGLPLVDADGMGRAFPKLQMVTLTMGDISATPMSICDAKGNTVFTEAIDNTFAEQIVRATSAEMGGTCLIAAYPHTGAECRAHAVVGSLSFAHAIGSVIKTAREASHDPIKALCTVADGHELFTGKIVDVDRTTQSSFAVGTATIQGLQADDGAEITLEFQNEYLVARHSTAGIIASVPDLIVVCDADTADPIPVEELTYGSRVRVLGLPSPDAWTTEEGLALVGPNCFGYDIEYKPIEEIQEQ